MFRKLTLACAISLALAPVGASALGLGGLRTGSALNQPFYGEIQLLDVNADELDTVKVQLAPVGDYDRAGVERVHFLSKLRFKPQALPDGRSVVRVSSAQPIREPFIDFLVEVIWPKGRLVKEYTVLLDPPVTAEKRAPKIVPPTAAEPRRFNPAGAGSAQAAAAAQQSAPPAAAPPPAAAAVPANVSRSGFPIRYGPVPNGVGLWRVARKISPPGATVAQTAMALYRNNASAFIRGNINRLMVGRTLVIPTPEELYALDVAAAEREFQNALAGRKVTSRPMTNVAAAGARPELRIADATAARVGADQAAAPDGVGQSSASVAQMQAQMLTMQEAAEANRQEISELRERNLQLEQRLADIQKLLTLSNERLAGLQDSGVTAPSAEATDRPPERRGEATTVEPAPDLIPVEPEAPVVEAPVEIPAEIPAEVAVVEPVEPVASIEATEPVIGEPLPMAPPGAEAEPVRVVSPDVPKVDLLPPDAPALGGEPDVVPEPAGSITDSLTQSVAGVPLWAFGAGGAALLGGLGFVALRRRRQLQESSAGEAMALSEPSPEGESARGDSVFSVGEAPSLPPSEMADPASAFDSSPATEEPAVPAAQASTATSSTSYPIYRDIEEETQEADIISEADIYIAYGRYREAESLLLEEIEKSPGRLDLKLKLAETYKASKNNDGMQRVAGEFARIERAQVASPEQWERIQAALADAQALGPSEADPDDLDMSAPVVAFGGGNSYGATDTSVTDLPLSLDSEGSSGRPSSLDLELDDLDNISLPPSDDSLRNRDDDLSSGLSLGGVTDLTADELSELDLSGLSEVKPPKKAAPSATPTPPNDDLSSVDISSLPADDSLLDDTGLMTESASDLDSLGPPSSPPASIYGGDSNVRGLHSVKPRSSQVREPTVVTDGMPESTTFADDSMNSDVLSSQWKMDSGLWDEVATKMDLARAYVEMEDPDAARAILEEVAEEGSEEQQAEAKELLSRLS